MLPTRIALLPALLAVALPAAGAAESVPVFVLAGDECVLRRGSIDGASPEPSRQGVATEDDRRKPGTLHEVLGRRPEFAALREASGAWVARPDVALYDAHPLSNNTRSPAQALALPTDPGDPLGFGVGVERMFGEVVGNHLDDPVLLLRFATAHPTWFRRGSRSLGYDYLPPSSGGGLDLDGGWDVIHFNFGVWDQQYVKPGQPHQRAEPGQGVIRTSLEDYERNLRTIVGHLRQTKATLVWASTTPIRVGTPPAYVGGEMVDRYNAVAARIMAEHGVLINDLHAECVRMGRPQTLNVHDVGNLAPKVTEVVQAALQSRANPSRPLPRVLFIGDSITGSYWEQVQRNLDGKAFVAKNPGNAEHSGTGVRMVEAWIDLQRYLLNGQEYLELVDGVRQTLAEFDRYCPPFAGRTPRLAGLVWFQGIADTQSPAFADAYEKNLVALIEDLRRAFNHPDLPVVVATLGQSGPAMSAGFRKVHAAQKAVGQPGRYPALGDRVVSVDTIPFCFPADRSPGGREWDFHRNAESYLLIGEALGKEMLRLLR